ncbi:MAG: SurA N-terminal domain-containing protein [Myxococcota bacterium]|jgi:peptidyl-prolyl cis-trans isomerase D|nr:SurA N-terminal domain-containing protein [Myxococcota bacterium]
MLQSLRRHSQSFFIYVLFGMLIVVFVFMFGLPNTDSCNPQTKQVAADVGQFGVDEDLLRSSVAKVFGEYLRGGEEEFFARQRQVLYNIVTVLLIADKAEAAGLRVSDEELRAYIVDPAKGNPDAFLFQKEKAFDKKLYQTRLDLFGITPENYERYKRREILARNYLTLLEASLVPSDAELREAFAREANSLNLRFVALEDRHVQHLVETPSETDVATFLSANMDAVSEFYKSNERQYKIPARVHLQELIIQRRADLIRETGEGTDLKLSAEDRFALAKKKVFEEGMSLEEAVRLYNEAVVNRETGDRGFSDLDNMSEQYRTAIESKSVGELVAFETELHYVIVKVLERTEAVETPLDQAQFDIARTLVHRQRSSSKVEELAKAVHAKVAAGEDMQAALDGLLYAGVLETKPEPAPQDAPATEDAPVPSPEEALPEAELPTDPIAEGPAPAPADLVPEAPSPAPPESAPEALVIPLEERAKVDETGPFSLNAGVGDSWSYLPKLGNSPALARAVLKLQTPNELVPSVYPVENARVVAMLIERKQGSEEDFAAQRADLSRRIMEDKSSKLLGNWRLLLFLAHEDPKTEPYGPWIQAIFDEAEQNRSFTIGSAFLTPPTPPAS